MVNSFKYPSRSIMSIAVIFLIGCKRQQIVYYEIAKKDNRIEQVARDISGNSELNMESRGRPPETLGSAANPHWILPEGWLPGKASTMRRGSFTVMGPDNQGVDISVTTFPGDVGGDRGPTRRGRELGQCHLSLL